MAADDVSLAVTCRAPVQLFPHCEEQRETERECGECAVEEQVGDKEEGGG